MKKTLVKSTALVLVFAMLLSVFAVFGSVNAKAETLPEHTKPIGIVGIIQNRVEIAKERVGNALGAAKHAIDGAIQFNHDVVQLVVTEGPEAYQKGVDAFVDNSTQRIKDIINWHVENAAHLIQDRIVAPVEDAVIKAKAKEAEFAAKFIAKVTAVKAAVETAKAAVKTAIIVRTGKIVGGIVGKAQDAAQAIIRFNAAKKVVEIVAGKAHTLAGKVLRFEAAKKLAENAKQLHIIVVKAVKANVAKAIAGKFIGTTKGIIAANIAKAVAVKAAVQKAAVNAINKAAEMTKTAIKVKLAKATVKGAVRTAIFMFTDPIFIFRPIWLLF